MSEARTTELLEISLGACGSKEITGTSAVTPDQGKFVALQVISDAVFSAQTDDGTTNADLTAFTSVVAGTIIYGKWSSITLTSGEVIAYQG